MWGLKKFIQRVLQENHVYVQVILIAHISIEGLLDTYMEIEFLFFPDETEFHFVKSSIFLLR